jgi:hypothetical protein
MKFVQVISYSGYKADESPRQLKIGDTLLPIAQIEDRWYSPGETFFRVLTQTGDRYLLRHVKARRTPGRSKAFAAVALTPLKRGAYSQCIPPARGGL